MNADLDVPQYCLCSSVFGSDNLGRLIQYAVISPLSFVCTFTHTVFYRVFGWDGVIGWKFTTTAILVVHPRNFLREVSDTWRSLFYRPEQFTRVNVDITRFREPPKQVEGNDPARFCMHIRYPRRIRTHGQIL